MRARIVVASVCVAFVSAFAPRAARADVVGPPPTDCPDGAFGTSCHGAEMCVAYSCTTDRECPAGTRCRPTAFCMTEQLCYGTGTTRVTAVVASCAAADCTVGDCLAVLACVHPPEEPDSGTVGREVVTYSCCSCSVTTGSRRSAIGVAITLVALVVARRLWRRRGRPRG